MNDFNIELLELVECYAEENNLIASEEALSELFDSQVMPDLIKVWYDNPQNEGREFCDQVMVNEAFNNWSDSLCKDHQLHEEQCNKYCYEGKYSDL